MLEYRVSMFVSIPHVVGVHRVAGTGQGVDHDAHAVLLPILNGVIVKRLQHFALQTDAASGGVAVRGSASSNE